MTSITTVKTPRRACHGAAAKPRRELGLVAGLYFVCPQGKSIFEDGFPQQASQGFSSAVFANRPNKAGEVRR